MGRRSVSSALLLAVVTLSTAGVAGSLNAEAAARAGSLAPPPITYVAGSTAKLCQLTGETDHETGRPTSSLTASRYGLVAADHGYSFVYEGKLWFFFGDAVPTRTFNGHSNTAIRWPYDRSSLINDAIAYATTRGADGCPVLNFVPWAPGTPGAAPGAYADPVVTTTKGDLSLRTNESPNAGIAVGGHMYAVFATDNPTATCTPSTCSKLGAPTRSVMGELIDPTTLTFKDLYNFSAPRTPKGNGAKFVYVAIAEDDGWLYFWGTKAGSLYRHSAVYLARKLAATIATPGGFEYLHGTRAGAPVWRSSEASATPLFDDHPNCASTVGAEYDAYLTQWLLLYDCRDNSVSNPAGIWMRHAAEPWGPWSAPQTIFDPVTNHGYCHFIDHPTCTNKFKGSKGTFYGPFFVAGWTTGTIPTPTRPATSTIYYTLDTFQPYGQVILSTVLDGHLTVNHVPTKTPSPCPPRKPGQPITCT